MTENNPKLIKISDIPIADNVPSAGPLLFTHFARKSTLSRSNGKLYGQFSNSFGGACVNGMPGYIEEGVIEEMSDAGRCSGSNEEVVRIDHQ